MYVIAGGIVLRGIAGVQEKRACLCNLLFSVSPDQCFGLKQQEQPSLSDSVGVAHHKVCIVSMMIANAVNFHKITPSAKLYSYHTMCLHALQYNFKKMQKMYVKNAGSYILFSMDSCYNKIKTRASSSEITVF